MAYGTVNVPGAESTIETILVNGEEIAPDSSKAVDIPVPTAVSELTNDSGYLTEHPDVEMVNNYGNASTQTLDWGSTTGKVLVGMTRDDNGHVKDWTTINFTMPENPAPSAVSELENDAGYTSVAMMNITYSGQGTAVALDISEAGIEPTAIKMTNLSTYAPAAWYDGTAIVTVAGFIDSVSSDSFTFAGSPADYLVEIYGTKV